MRNLALVSAVVFATLLAAPLAKAQSPSPWGQYLKAYTATADAQAKLVDAQAKLISAQAVLVTAISNAGATNAKTLETLEQVRGLRMDNDLKRTKTFYDKRALYATYQGLNEKKRPSQEDVIRYSKVFRPSRLAGSQLSMVKNENSWPAVLQREEFSEQRLQLKCLFAQRGATGSHDIALPVQKVAEEMRVSLRSMIRQVPPDQYLAGCKFIDSLAYESRFTGQIEGIASN